MPTGTSPTEEQARSRGVDFSTLIVAALAAAVAAVVASKIWQPGTLMATAMTPVIVSLLKEWLQRPVEKVTEVARAPLVAVRSTPLRTPAFARPAGPEEAERRGRIVEPEPRRPDRDDYERLETVVPPGEDHEAAAPYRVYRRRPRRPPWWKVGLVTGVLAFLVAAVALTVPELVGGKSVTGSGSTTLFGQGSGSSSRQQDGSGQGGSSTSTTPSSSQPSQGTSKDQSSPTTRSSPSGSGRQSTPSGSGSGSGGSTSSQPSAPQSGAPAAPSGSGGGSSSGGG